MNLGAILENLALEAYAEEEEAREDQRARVAIPPLPSNRPCFWRPWEDSEESEEAGDFRTRQLLRRYGGNEDESDSGFKSGERAVVYSGNIRNGREGWLQPPHLT